MVGLACPVGLVGLVGLVSLVGLLGLIGLVGKVAVVSGGSSWHLWSCGSGDYCESYGCVGSGGCSLWSTKL